MRNQSAARTRSSEVHAEPASALTVAPQIKSASLTPLPFRRRELIPEGQRQEMIRKAAYFRAQARGFDPGHEVEDWLDAEQEVNEVIVRRYG